MSTPNKIDVLVEDFVNTLRSQSLVEIIENVRVDEFQQVLTTIRQRFEDEGIPITITHKPSQAFGARPLPNPEEVDVNQLSDQLYGGKYASISSK